MPFLWTAAAAVCLVVGLLVTRVIRIVEDGMGECGPGKVSAGPVVVVPAAAGQGDVTVREDT